MKRKILEYSLLILIALMVIGALIGSWDENDLKQSTAIDLQWQNIQHLLEENARLKTRITSIEEYLGFPIPPDNLRMIPKRRAD